MASHPGTTKKRVSNTVTLPKNWRTTLPKRVGKLPFPNLSIAFNDASAILGERTDAELQRIARDLRQLLAQYLPPPTKGGIDYHGFDVDPRVIYCLHVPFEVEKAIDFVAFRDRLAVATVMELARACDAFSDAHDQPTWVKAAQAMANARALSEWLYVSCTLLVGGQAEKSASQDVRAAVKAKIKKAKSEAAKKGWRKVHKSDKQLVIDYYERHKSKFKNSTHAAKEITKAKLVLMEHSTIYKWLLKHVKKQKG